MKRSFLLSFVLGAALLLNGCATTGRNFPSRTDWIKKNNTSQQDVRLVLGEPYAVGNSGGVSTWTYAYYSYNIMNKSAYKELKVYWTPAGKVKYFSFNSSFIDDIQKGKAEFMANKSGDGEVKE